MHVALVYLSGGGLSGGAATTLRRQVPLLVGDERISRFDLFLPPQSADLSGLGAEVQTWPRRDRWRGLKTLKARIRELRPDVVFIPTAAWFDTGDIPTVCMVRNTEPILLPFGDNPLREGFKNAIRARAARSACRRSTRVIAVSQFVRELVVDRWRIPANRVGVVYHGVAEATQPAEQQKPAAMVGQNVERFWFTAGSLLPYRGLEDIILALATRRSAGEYLLVAGKGVYSDDYQNRMKRLAERYGLADRVIWLGHRPAAELSWCYANCLGFVMTSQIEACPNVVLEALSHGCACVSTKCSPMPEFFRDTANYYESGDAD